MPRRAARDWPRPTWRGAALLVGGVLLIGGSFFWELRGLLLPGFVALAMPLFAMLLVGLRRPVLEIGRRFEPAMLPAGETANVVLTVRNLGRRPLDGAVWRDEIPAPLEPAEESVLPALAAVERGRTGGDDTAGLRYRVIPPRRGVHLIGPLRVAVFDPFGLARAGASYGAARELVAMPWVQALSGESGGAAGGDGTVNAIMRRSHPNSDELTAREYRHGDPYRRVHWRATARRGELMVRQEEQRGDPEARLILETGAAAQAQGGERLEPDGSIAQLGFELGVEIAAAVGVRLLEEGFRLQFSETAPAAAAARGGLFGDPPRTYRAPDGEHRFLEDLARIGSPGRHAAHDGRGDDGRAPVLAGRSRLERRPGFAVLVDPDDEIASALAVLGPGLEPRVAFLLESVRPEVRRTLESADWRCVAVERLGDVVVAWESLRTGVWAVAADA